MRAPQISPRSAHKRDARALPAAIVWVSLSAIGVAAGAALYDRLSISTTSASQQDRPWFEEAGKSLGIDFVHSSGHRGRRLFPEIMCGGVCAFDYDGDGWVDLYFVQGGSLYEDEADKPGNKLYRNEGGRSFADVTDDSGTGHAGYGMGCTAADYDNDGDIDLYVTNVGPNALLRNDGDGTFTDVTEQAGVGNALWGTSALFADYDRDGLLDLFVTNYVYWSFVVERDCFTPDGRKDYCTPGRYGPAPDVLYRNLGDGTFDDVSERAGLRTVFGKGLGVASGDFNSDGWSDYYVANDQTANQLWIGDGDGTFSESALLAGCALNMDGLVEAGMGVASVDADNDGDLDLFISHLRGETNTLYRNDGGLFLDATDEFGLGVPSIRFTGFGLSFADFNHDGYLDVYIANGRVALHDAGMDSGDPYAEVNQVLSADACFKFREIMPRGGTGDALVATSRATAALDLDNDGAVDIAIVNKDDRCHVLRNRVDGKNSWVGFRVLDRTGRDAIGAMVGARFGGRTVWRHVQPGSGYLSSNDPRIHIGLGEHRTVDDLAIRWADGSESSRGSFAAGQYHVIRRAAD